ncbi:hypothetical protein G7054_g12955 [Neopestalotiopsis clavispora]|nr:hypothetical protein E8E14_011017 [Neopestalotiopsis sp. 37M]KAF7519876.1 hypothetical protein G7054_g12955 [Neopestalotiopsis clavispora]
MSKQYLAAKEKYDAVVSNPGRRDSTSYKNRTIVGRAPSSGSTGMIGHVDHAPSRRMSNSFGDRVKDWMNRPAF